MRRSASRGVTLLIFLAIIPFMLSLTPSAISQSLTTITRLQTFTTAGTFTFTNTVTSQTTRSNVETNSITSSSALATTKTLYSQRIDINIVDPEYGCTPNILTYTAKEGQLVSVTFTADGEVSFFILGKNAYKTWYDTRHCSVDNAIEEAYAVTSYSADILTPKDDIYYLLFLNFSHTTASHIKLLAVIGANAVVVSSVSTIFTTLERRSTSTQARFATKTSTSTVIITEQIGMFSMGGQILPLIIAVVVIVAAVLGFILYRTMLRKHAPTAAKQQAEGSFCVNCAARLPAGAKFCNKCGATQT